MMKKETRELLETPYTVPTHQNLSKEQIRELLSSTGGDMILLNTKAREVREIYFPYGPNLRAVIEVSNKCRVNCDYCAMRRDNNDLERYTLTQEEIINSAREVYSLKSKVFYFKSGDEYEAKFKRLFLQSGEDPSVLDVIIPAVKKIKSEMPEFEIVGCMGEFKKEEYKLLKDAGMDSYILKFEISNPELYKKFRHRDIEDRLNCLEYLKELDFNVGTGTIVNLPGQTLDDLANDLLLIQKLKPLTASTCPFMPNEGSLFNNEPIGKLEDSLNMNSVLRLLSPTTCTASCSPYEKIKPGEGQKDGFNAGCTNITIRVTPKRVRHLFQLYNKDRTTISPEHAYEVIKHAVWNWESE